MVTLTVQTRRKKVEGEEVRGFKKNLDLKRYMREFFFNFEKIKHMEGEKSFG